MTLRCGSRPVPCGCCEGTEVLTPMMTANRPGLSALAYRVGIYATFLETMKARLSSRDFPELRGLTTRDSGDPAIALLDAWATVADVLTFYQERIANEGYLRTATERRSILELARLVGYNLRPGVAASVYLAFTLENNYRVEIPVGARAQSLPGPGELPQSFETAEKLEARAEWNDLKPRKMRPQNIKQSVDGETIDAETIYFQGIAKNLKPNDPLLFVFGDGPDRQLLRHAKAVELQAADLRTKVTLQEAPTTAAGPVRVLSAAVTPKDSALDVLGTLLDPLSIPPSQQPPNSLRLTRDFKETFDVQRDLGPQLLAAFRPTLGPVLYQALGGAVVAQPAPLQDVYALRVKAALFGHNLPIPAPYTGGIPIGIVSEGSDEPLKALALDAEYKEIIRDSWVSIARRDRTEPIIAKVVDVQTVTLGGPQQGDLRFFSTQSPTGQPPSEPVRIRVTLLKLDRPWLNEDDFDDPEPILRQSTVYAQSEELTLAERPMEEDICRDDRLELGDLYDGLQSGRWVIVSGERTDLPLNTSGIKSSELVMLTGVEQGFDPSLPGDRTHSTLILANKLAYCYKRDSVTIYGNVVKATHGETRSEVLGSGDGSKSLQQFALRQSPLTFLSAPTPAGAESTLQVRINDILWHESESLDALKPTDRNFITRTDDQGKTTITFGNGKQGARLPAGIENVKAIYRTGIGKPGNVRAEQISLLATKPLGVKSVINPLRASGGADPENRDQARRNVPLAVMALDRLVSTRDYEDFARTHAGIGKASAVRLSDGHQELVHLTIAGADDIPIDGSSDLYRNLFQALHQFGDPFQPIQVATRELMLLVIIGKVRLQPDYQWESVEPEIRAAMLDAFGFDRRELGQSVFLSEIISTIQQVVGVNYVDVDALDSVSETEATTPGQLEKKLKELVDTASAPDAKPRDFIYVREAKARSQAQCAQGPQSSTQDGICPAQLAILSPSVPDTLILNLLEVNS